MTTRFFSTLALFLAAATLVLAQKPKSQKEVDALLAVQNAQTPEATVSAVDTLIAKFADTEFKSWAFQRAADAEQRKGDSVNAMIYAQRALDADPKAYSAMLLMSGELARSTREFDLDKDDKLNRAEKLAKDALGVIPSVPKPNAAMTDAQWAGVKKDVTAQAHEDLGLVAMGRKKYDVAITEYQTSIDTASTPEPADTVRLAAAYNQAGKPDEALAAINKALAMPNVSAPVKTFAEAEKKRAEDAKNAKK